MKRRWSRIEPAPLAGAEGEERFLHLVESLQQGMTRNLRDSGKQAQQLVCGRQDKVRPTQMVRATDLHTRHTRAGCWNVQLDSRPRGPCSSVEGTIWENESEAPQPGMLVEKHRPPQKGNTRVEWLAKGHSHHCSFSPHTLAPASTGIREGSHQSQLPHPCHRLLHFRPLPDQVWVTCSPWSPATFNPHHSTLLPGQPAHPHLPPWFLPVWRARVFWQPLRERGMWEGHTHTSQRWGWNHSWAQGPWN